MCMVDSSEVKNELLLKLLQILLKLLHADAGTMPVCVDAKTKLKVPQQRETISESVLYSTQARSYKCLVLMTVICK